MALAFARIGTGAALALAPRPALRALGFANPSDQTIVVSRLAGGRDLVMGAATVLARDDPLRLAAASFANAAVDAGDAAAFAAAALDAGGGAKSAGLRGLAVAAPAALAGLWIGSRLRRS